MEKIVEQLRKKRDLISGESVSGFAVDDAENRLGLKFAEEYREYIKEFGFVCYDGHELTGVCKAKRLNVVNVTEKEREYVKNVPTDAYVIEQTHIDGIVIWQTTDGDVYQSQGNSFKKINNSLAEYVG